MASIFNGVAMDFGAGDASLTAISGKIGTFKVQDWNYSAKADLDETRDANGIIVATTHYNPTFDATFDVVVSGSGLANAITQTIIPPPGTIATITSAANSYPIAGTNWIVVDAEVKASNTKNKMISIKLKQYPAITAAAPA